MIYVVASQQDLHLAQLFKIEELMGRKDISDKCQHINFGMVLGPSHLFTPNTPYQTC
jgi:arginyl-tRNA synthetase